MSVLKSRGKLISYVDLMKAWSEEPKTLSIKERLKAETSGISDMWTAKIWLSHFQKFLKKENLECTIQLRNDLACFQDLQKKAEDEGHIKQTARRKKVANTLIEDLSILLKSAWNHPDLITHGRFILRHDPSATKGEKDYKYLQRDYI